MDEALQERIAGFVSEQFAGAYDIYDINLRRDHRRLVLTVTIDAAQPIGIEDCEKVSRALSQWLDAHDPIPGRYVLEVSSPGVERVLRRPVDFQRSVGRLVRWTLKPSSAGGPKEVFSARLQEVWPDRVRVAETAALRELPLDQVLEARTVLEFPRKRRG